MNRTDPGGREPHTAPERTDQGGLSLRISVSELLLVLLSSRRFVLAAAAAGLVAGGLLVLFQSPVYRTQATLLPESNSFSTRLSPNLAQPMMMWPMGTRGTGAIYAEVLRSRAVAEMVSERMGYSEWLPEPLARADRERVAVGRIHRAVEVIQAAGVRFYTSLGTITVSVDADDPVRASDIANTYLFALDEYFSENAVTSASRLRRFLERRLVETNRELEEAQIDLQGFQEKHGAININQQASATIQLLSELEARRVGYSVEKVAEEERYSPAHSSVRVLQAKIDALQEVIDRLTFSREDQVPYERDGRVEFFVPLKMIPELSFEASRKLLALKSKEGVVSLFTSRLEQAKIDEASNLPSVDVLDLAGAGMLVRPRKKVNLGIGLLTGLVLGSIISWGKWYGRLALQRVSPDSNTAALIDELQRLRQLAWSALVTARAYLRLGSRRGRADGEVRDG